MRVMDEINGKNYKAQNECPELINQYERRSAAATRILKIAIRKFTPGQRDEIRMGHLDNYLTAYSSTSSKKVASPAYFKVLDDVLDKFTSRVFSLQEEAKPNTSDVFCHLNGSIIIPDLNNRELTKLYDLLSEASINMPSQKLGSLEHAYFLTTELRAHIRYDIRWALLKFDDIVYLEEALAKREGTCKELAAMLYVLLKKGGFEDVSLINGFDEQTRQGHTWVKVKINGKEYRADPTSRTFGPYDSIDSCFVPNTSEVLEANLVLAQRK